MENIQHFTTENGITSKEASQDEISPDSPHTPLNVHFRSGNLTLAGHLYIPRNYKTNEKRAAILVVAPGGGVKEQTSGRYAMELCKKGFVTMSFDHRSYGESEGFPRFDEDPYNKIEDIKNAVSYLTNRLEVNLNAIGLIGICGGGGYGPAAAAADRRIKAVATVSGMPDPKGAILEQFGTEGLVAAFEASSKARQAFSQGAEPLYYPLIPPAGAPNVMELLKQAPDYYFDSARGANPNWDNKTLAWSFEKLASFSALDSIKLISPNPVLFIAGSKAASRKANELAYQTANEPKELFIIEGSTHLDLYDIDCYVEPAVDKLTFFFNENLNG
ncbi:alpha/beta hydrolase [Pedobacter sp. MR22-3]|uniref:alpha/beta hydrolase n=1 Tax=Pedobacter sp. MR22-3 TaxID=2994552 RepID=UPI00104771E1|nr:alpha/beta hydrolase [Pedobacter sp. MR22-3]MCX2584428.1 alpha/beta hydrolase [Pedobacter sp. MR22-3]